MAIVRFTNSPAGDDGVGILRGDTVHALAGVRRISDLLRLPSSDLRSRCAEPDGARFLLADVTLLPPVDGRMEVWAAGVTYTVSRTERVAESQRMATVYEQVYDAVRPELFFKAPAWRVVTDNDPIAIRDDSEIDVPEPELAVAIGADGSVVGYLACNDMSSRSIEGENPLYLPQAKVYDGSCALSNGIRPAWEVDDPYRLDITMRIERAGATAWEGSANTSQLRRSIPDLVRYLTSATHFPDGAILATGTCVVPPLPFTLAPDDVVSIDIGDVGTLRNRVVRGRDQMAWLYRVGPAGSSVA
jgi:2-dehydro-3-deoxy-D-arabinonate dehydratase